MTGRSTTATLNDMGKHTIAEAQEHLPELIDRAIAGEAVTIVRAGGDTVELKPRVGEPVGSKKQRAAHPGSEDPHGLKRLRSLRSDLPKLDIDVVELVSRMRDEDWP